MAQELFERVDRKVGNLLDDVINGRIGLPDLQRPFVWADAKVRNLFDSMMKGFPIGYVMLWASPADYINTKSIGVGEKEFKRPDDLVIDGQQRLTTLFLLHWYLSLVTTDDKAKELFYGKILRDGKSMFTYRTRSSSTEFCEGAFEWNEYSTGIDMRSSMSVVSRRRSVDTSDEVRSKYPA